MASVIPKISYLSNSIIRVLGCNPGPMTLQGTNTYIIGTGQRRVLLDTGEENNPEYISNLRSVLKENNIVLDSIILSHWHHDHVGGLKDVLPLNAGEAVKVMKHPRTDAPDAPLNAAAPSSVRWLEGGEEIKVEGATLRTIWTPGHTTDHVVLSLEEEKAVFSGDCILGEGTAVFEDLFQYMKSLQIILDCNPSVIYPGHGPVIEDPVSRVQHYIDHRNQREAQILEVLTRNPDDTFTPMSLVKVIYMDTPSSLHLAAAYNVSHHLKKLREEGKVSCHADDSYSVVKSSL